MACSPFSLSLATILAVSATVCLTIGFSTDSWNHIVVNLTTPEQTSDTDLRYYTRDEGLFRICFPEKKPSKLETYISPTQTECVNVNYYIPTDDVSDSFSDTRWERLHMARSVVALYVVSFFFLFLSFFTGIAGCWKRSHANLVATGILQLIASLMDAAAMGLWHAVQFYDIHQLKDEWSYYGWPQILKQNGVTEFYYGWSYIIAWIGIGQLLIAAIVFLSAARCIRFEKRSEQIKNMQYLMPVYPDKRNPYAASYAYAYPGPYAAAYQHHHAAAGYGMGPYAGPY